MLKGFGSPELNKIVNENSVVLSSEFPSMANEKQERRGGVMLFQLKPNKEGKKKKKEKEIIATTKINKKNILAENQLEVQVDHDNLNGIKEQSSTNLKYLDGFYFAENGIRKAILLVRYTDLVKHALNERR